LPSRHDVGRYVEPTGVNTTDAKPISQYSD